MACNFCMLEAAKRIAEDRRHELTLQPSPKPGFPEGVTVSVHPAGEPPDDWFVMWLACLPDSCVC